MNNKLINIKQKNQIFDYHTFDIRKKVGIFSDFRPDLDPESDPDLFRFFPIRIRRSGSISK